MTQQPHYIDCITNHCFIAGIWLSHCNYVMMYVNYWRVWYRGGKIAFKPNRVLISSALCSFLSLPLSALANLFNHMSLSLSHPFSNSAPSPPQSIFSPCLIASSLSHPAPSPTQTHILLILCLYLCLIHPKIQLPHLLKSIFSPWLIASSQFGSNSLYLSLSLTSGRWPSKSYKRRVI